MTIVDICIVLCTIFFIVLVIYLIRTFLNIQKSLDLINNLIILLQPKLEKGGEETLTLLHRTNEILTLTSNAFNPLLQSMSDLGSALQKKIHSLNSSEDNRKIHHRNQIDEVIELIAYGILFWQQIKKRR